MMVTINHKYCISEEDSLLLKETKRAWWLKNIDTGQFINYDKGRQKLKCTEPISIELELPVGRYTFGCGDWEVVSPTTGRKVSQKCYFFVDSLGACVCKYNELPPLETLVDEKRACEVAEKINVPPSEVVIVPTDMEIINGKYYCAFSGEIVDRDSTCSEFRSKESAQSTKMMCDNCSLADQILRMMPLGN